MSATSLAVNVSVSGSSPESTPNRSWRMTTHSSCRKSSHRRLKGASEELLQCSAENPSLPRVSNCESRNSSLRNPNFDSDSDPKSSNENNSKIKMGSLSARKKLQFERMLNLEDGRKLRSPKNKSKTTPPYLKTPIENGFESFDSPPKRATHGRRSLITEDSNTSPEDLVKNVNFDNSERDSCRKHIRSDLPKARMSLFNDDDSRKVIPVKSFYSKMDKITVPIDHSIKFVNVKSHIREPKSIRHRSCKYYNRLKRNKKTDINRGVRHGIRKPKLNKKSYLSKARALKLSMDLIENSPLNDYIDNFMKCDNGSSYNNFSNFKQTTLDQRDDVENLNIQFYGFKKDLVAEPIVYTDDDDDDDHNEENSKETNNKNKFFKSSRNLKKKAIVKLPSMNLQVKNGKLLLPKQKQMPLNEISVAEQNIAKHFASMHKDVTDLLNDNDDISEKSTIDLLLNQWSEEDVPETEPHATLQTDDVHRNIKKAEQLLQLKQNALSSIDDSSYLLADLNDDDSTSTDIAYTSDLNSQPSVKNYDLLPIDEGYILVEDVHITEVNESDYINSEVSEKEGKSIETIQTKNIDPEILLSPTTQMCSMTSDLVLNSPITMSSDLISNTVINSDKLPDITNDKLYSVFKNTTNKTKRQILENTCTKSNIRKKIKLSSTKDQYLIDAGQKKFGITQCIECGVIYQIGDTADENDHMMHHTAADILKFPGWKTERLCGRWEEGRAIVIVPGDPASHWQRVSDLLDRVIHPQLGYAAPLNLEKFYKIYLYIERKKIVGCLVAEVLHQANKLIRDGNIDCCSNELYPVKCGVSRIWTHKSHRRKRIASNLLNSMRLNFIHGHVLLCEEIAFSSPTPMGRLFAEKYTKIPDFYVYIN